MVDFPTGVTATDPTFLLGANATDPAKAAITAAGRTLIAAADAAAERTAMGLGTAAVLASTAVAQTANNLSDLANAGTARTNLGLGTAATLASTAVAQTANNLSDLANAGTARTNLGLGALATKASAAESDLALTDIATANADTTKHGFLPKLPTSLVNLVANSGWFGVGAMLTDFVQFPHVYEDFLGGGNGSFAVGTSGTGAATNFSGSDATAWGILSLIVGTTATGRAQVGLATSGAPQNIYLGIGEALFSQRSRLSALSTGTDTYTARIGYGAAVGGGDPTNGVLFRYTDGVNSGKWQAVCRKAGVETTADTGIAADTSMHRYEFIVNAAGTSVGFYIDGTLVATITTNIPAATGNVAMETSIGKSAGTTSVQMDVDFIFTGCYLTARR